MKTSLKEVELKRYCELFWWNFGKKTTYFKGELGELLKKQGIKFTKRKTDNDFVFKFHFKNEYGISFKTKGLLQDFPFFAKQFIQMELVRMGDKSELYIAGVWRPTVTVNK